MLAVAPPPPPPPIVVRDRAGDSGTAPDITKVTVTTKKSGVITFIVVFKTPYGSNSTLYAYIGTHQYRLGPAGLEVWDDASTAQDYEPTGAFDVTFSVAPGGRALETSCSLADIGRPKAFRWTVVSIDGDGGAGHQDSVAGAWPRRR
ncbi:MAG: hypothetical protein KGI93_06745 [Acidobacteriota bacterium]|nr:hypothetical protein [Acidobacteriota bacterium]MDE3190688.1 hypothetical protein [Acidobacteriota bacterium]